MGCFENFSAFRECLGRMDLNQLPGLDGQLRMAPEMRHQDIRSRGVGRDTVMSSVLFLFYPSGSGVPVTVLIQRSEYNGAHSGQISFPGGRYEKDDHDLMHTALRETSEEIGVDPTDVQVIGSLTDLYIPPSNFLVRPYLAITEKRPAFKPDPQEVAGIIEIDVADFFLASNCQSKAIRISNGALINTPCFLINGHVIWGATAMMISEWLVAMQQEGAGVVNQT